MKVLVVGGTGNVGSQVARELSARGAEVRILTRNPAKARDLPKGAQTVEGDLLKPATIRSAFTGMDGVFLLNPVSATEAHEGLLAVNGARLARVSRIVYLSVHRADEAVSLPHFGSKVAVELALKSSGIACTVLRPNNFYQNDAWFKDALLGYGVYPQPLGDVGVSRVDVRDVAEAAALALMSDASGFDMLNLVGPTPHTGKSTAEVWSRVLGKPVQYGGNDLDAWEKQAAQMLPDWMAFDFRLMYEHFGKRGLRADAEDIERMTRFLGHPPRPFETYAAETAAVWKG